MFIDASRYEGFAIRELKEICEANYMGQLKRLETALEVAMKRKTALVAFPELADDLATVRKLRVERGNRKEVCPCCNREW